MKTVFRRALLIAACAASPAAAASFQDIDALEAQVVAALGAGLGETGGPSSPIDRRLRLAACPDMVSVEPPVMGAATLRCEPLGWRIRVPLVRGASQAIAAKAEPLIRKGDQVELVALAGHFTVSTLATAEQDGAAGQRIRVRSDRKAAVTGMVTDDGRVALPGFK